MQAQNDLDLEGCKTMQRLAYWRDYLGNRCPARMQHIDDLQQENCVRIELPLAESCPRTGARRSLVKAPSRQSSLRPEAATRSQQTQGYKAHNYVNVQIVACPAGDSSRTCEFAKCTTCPTSWRPVHKRERECCVGVCLFCPGRSVRQCCCS